eukprot:m.11622 g.11622  ORF g.11622 m.11622 type:complete len:164 (+) comp7455_c0_seq2:419-910(+)
MPSDPTAAAPNHPLESTSAETPPTAKVADRIATYLEDSGVAVSDVPLAIFVHESMSVTLLIGAWGLCYMTRPSVALAGQFSRVAALRPAAEPFKNLVLSAQSRVNSAAWIRRTPLLRNADAGRLAVSLAESSVVRNVMRPLTIPGKLWITWFIITRWKGTASE